MLVKKDSFGRILENMVNSRPFEGGVSRKASYCAHEGVLYKQEAQANRNDILRENAILYNQNKRNLRHRKDTAGGVPLRIPQMDYDQLYINNPWLNTCDKETKAKFFKKLYKEHPEYRIG